MKKSDNHSVLKLQGEEGKRKKERNKVPLLTLISVFSCVISKTTFAFSLLNKLHMAMQFSLKSLA